MPVVNAGLTRNSFIPPSGASLVASFDGSLPAGFTFSRASNAWNPETGQVAPHNLCLQSNAFTTSPWIMTNAMGTAQNLVGVDGQVSGWTFTDSNASQISQIDQSITTVSGGRYVSSAFIRKTTGVQTGYPVMVAYASGNSSIALCTIDSSNGIASVWTAYTGLTVLNSSAHISSYNADWWRVDLTLDATTTSYKFYTILGTSSPSQTTGVVAGNVQGSFGITGYQVNQYSLTDYLPTTTAAVYGPRYVSGKSGQAIFIEESTTNILTAADSQSIATSVTCTTTAIAHTVSCKTGSITLSGTMTGTVTPGSPVTATATAGTLTLTGTATNIQVEAKGYKTTWTLGGTTRAVDTDSFNPTGVINAGLGSEMMPVTDFTTWTNSGASGITATSFTSGGASGVYKPGLFTTGKVYQITWTHTGGTLELRNGTTGVAPLISSQAAGTYTAQFVATANSGQEAYLYFRSPSAATITVSALTIKELTTAFTIAGWVYFDGIWLDSSTAACMFATTTSANQNRITIRKSGASLLQALTGDSAGTLATNTYTFSPVKGWHHIAVTIQSGVGPKIFYDGSPTGTNPSGTNTPSAVSTVAYVGGEYNNTVNANTAIDGFRIYPTVLTDAQIKQLYRSGR